MLYFKRVRACGRSSNLFFDSDTPESPSRTGTLVRNTTINTDTDAGAILVGLIPFN